MVVYLDLLFIINYVFNLFLLCISGWAGMQQNKAGRLFLAALAGNLFWLIFFFLPQYIFINWMCRILGGLAMAYIAWRPAGAKSLLSKTLLLVVSGQLVGGGIYSLAFALDSTPLGSSAPVSLSIVAGGGVVMVGIAAWWAGRIQKAKQLRSYLGQVKICIGTQTVTIPALLDSGNTLRGPVNNWPVVVIERDIARRLFDGQLVSWLDEPEAPPPEDWQTRIALIPYTTVGGSGLLAAVRPDSLVLYSEMGFATLRQVYVAVRQQNQPSLEFQALAFPWNNWRKESELG